MREIWKSVTGYEGLYEVSNIGNVRSLPRFTTRGVMLKFAPDKDGYYKVCLSNSNSKKSISVHRLVAIAFLPVPEKDQTLVNHKDENKQNNCALNLEWCTPKYNTNYLGASIRSANCRRKPINQFSPKMGLVKRWSCRREIENALKVSGGNITSCCNGNRKTAYGYLWRYA
jgi:hypothetical protein